MPEKKVILSYTKKYYTYTKEVDLKNLPNLDEVLAAYLRIFEGIAIAAKVQKASPYCFKKLMLFGELYTKVKNKVLTLAEAKEQGLSADNWATFLSSCLTSIVAAINRGEYDDPLVEIEEDKEKGGKYVRLKPTPIAMCWVEYAGGTLYCRPRKDPNGSINYGQLTYSREGERPSLFGAGTGTITPDDYDVPADRPVFFVLPVRENVFILWEQSVTAQTKQGFLVSPEKVRVITIPAGLRSTFNSDDPDPDADRGYPIGSMNYYFPLYRADASTTVPSQGGGTQPYDINWAFYLPWLSGSITQNVLDLFITGQSTAAIVANAYPGAQVQYQKENENGKFQYDETFFVSGTGNFQFIMGSPAYIAYALGYREANLGAFCASTWPQLKPLAVARESYSSGARVNSIRAPQQPVQWLFQDGSYSRTFQYGSCTGCFGSCPSGVTYDKTSAVALKYYGLFDQSLGKQYYYMFEVIDGVQPYFEKVVQDEDDGTNISAFNASQVGFYDRRTLDYAGFGWFWNNTLTEVSNTGKAPVTLMVSEQQRPVPFLNHNVIGNFITKLDNDPIYYEDFYGNLTSCAIAGRRQAADTPVLRDSGTTVMRRIYEDSGNSGAHLCNCNLTSRSGYSTESLLVDRTSTMAPAFCYTGLGVNYQQYLLQLGFSEDDLKFEPDTPGS